MARRTRFGLTFIVIATFSSVLVPGSSRAQKSANPPNREANGHVESPIHVERVTDIWPGKGGAIGIPKLYRGELYFRAHNRDSGMDVWRFDGKRAEIAIETARPAFDYDVRVEAV